MKRPLFKALAMGKTTGVIAVFLLVATACAQSHTTTSQTTATPQIAQPNTSSNANQNRENLQTTSKTSPADADGIEIETAIDRHLRQVLTQAGIKTGITSIVPSNFPNMYQVNLVDQPPLHMTADGKYVIQGELQKNPNQSKRFVRDTPTQIDSAKIGAPLDTEVPFYYTAVPGVLWSASLEGVPFLVSDDAQYFTDGEISVIENGEFTGLDDNFEKRKNQFVLSSLDEAQLISYPATSAERAIIYVATDVNCPYCRELHKQINRLNRKGVTVKMIGYPIYKQSPKQMRDIWCQPDNNSRRKALDNAMLAGKMTPAPASCTTNFVTPNRNRAAGLAVIATPMIFREDGVLYQASFESPEFMEFLGIE